MKKMILLGAAATMMALSASAQMSLVKDLSKKAASGDPQAMIEVLQNIEPAFTNPESANDVLTWYTAGKAAFGLYDKLYEMSLLKPDAVNAEMTEMMGAAVLSGYEYYMKALPLDSVPELDKNGAPKLNKDGSKKIKTKYSKEIIGSLSGHTSDILRVGNSCMDSEKYDLAADAYGYFADLAASPFAKKNGIEYPDSTISEIRFLQGYSQYHIKDYAGCYENCAKAHKMGYERNNITGYLTSSLANLVQGMLDNKEYEKANNFIDNALKNEPMNATLHDIKGFAVELMNGIDAALPYYKKTTEVDPTYANGFFDVGRCLYLQAQKIIDDNPNATNKELVPKIKPIYDEAIPYLKKAMELNAEDSKAKDVLDDIYYKFEVMGVK